MREREREREKEKRKERKGKRENVRFRKVNGCDLMCCCVTILYKRRPFLQPIIVKVAKIDFNRDDLC